MSKLQSFAKFIRRATQCSRDTHWRMKYDNREAIGIGSAGTCQDCGYRTEGIDWPRSCPPMPEVKDLVKEEVTSYFRQGPPTPPRPTSGRYSKGCTCKGCVMSRGPEQGYQPCHVRASEIGEGTPPEKDSTSYPPPPPVPPPARVLNEDVPLKPVGPSNSKIKEFFKL